MTRIKRVRAWAVVIAVTAGCFVGSSAADLRGCWTLDDGVDVSVADSSGYGNHGVARDTVWEIGVRNAGLKFLPGGWVRIPDAESLNPRDGISLEAWVMPWKSQDREGRTLIAKQGSYALQLNGDGTFSLFLEMDEGRFELRSETRARFNQWQHVAATYDGQRSVLYIDGSRDAVKTLTGRIARSSNDLCLGSAGGARPLHGKLDEVRLAGAAWDADELAASYDRGLYEAERYDSRFINVFKKDGKPEPTAVVPGFIWIEAEDFAEYGGWWMDTQFVPQMGSPYLLAAGIGTPVDEAATVFMAEAPGTYRLWVRSKNWLKDHAPGRFTVSVNGEDTGQVFGAEASGTWVWEDAGTYELAGETMLELIDQTGFYGRCDAFLFARDLAYIPPTERTAYVRERERLTGAFAGVRTVGDYDVVVVGAGVAGCNAAISAARSGAKTVLIQNRPMLGGNNSLEMGVPVLGPADYGKPNARETGLNEEIGREQAFNFLGKWSTAAERVASRETNLTVFVNTHVCDVEMSDDQTITAVKAFHMMTGEKTRYTGSVFIDCTGDGWLGYYAGAEYMLGRDARDTFGESRAPAEADSITMSGSLFHGSLLAYRSLDVGKPVRYEGPEWLWDLSSNTTNLQKRTGYEKSHRSGNWWHENAGDVDDLWDPEAARDGLIRVSLSYWNWIKNHSSLKEEAANLVLSDLPVTNAKRETRRLVGDHILTQDEVLRAEPFPDRVAYGGWGLDVHHPRGIFSPEGPFDFNTPTPLHHIPFRSLYAKDIANLLFAGRHISVSRIALGTTRVQGTTGVMGQAVGTAAALCVKHGTTPRGLYESRLCELQQTLLKADQSILGLVNEDPADLARGATAVASSERPGASFARADLVDTGVRHPMSHDRAFQFRRGGEDTLRRVVLQVSSTRPEATPLTLRLRGASRMGDFSSTTDLAVVTASVPAGRTTWVEFEMRCRIEDPYVWFLLPATEGLSLSMIDAGPPGLCRAYRSVAEPHWTVRAGQGYAFYLDTPILQPPACGPANVINGRTRVVGDQANMWVSDPGQSLPQWIELDLQGSPELNTLYLTFDTDLNDKKHCSARPPVQTDRFVPECVRDYQVVLYDGERWTTVADVRNNYQRRRVHRFPAQSATRLKVVVTRTNGDPSARIYEIRAYSESAP